MTENENEMLVDRLRATLARDRGETALYDEDVDTPVTRGAMASLAEQALAASEGLAEPGEAVAFVVRNRPAHLAALFGLLAARRPIRFVNAFQSPEKIAFDLRGLDARIALADATDCGRTALAEWSRGGKRLVSLEAGAISIVGRGDGAPGPRLPETAVELTTSGTTGAPKRVRLTAATLSAAIVDQARIAAEMGEAPASSAPEAALIQYAPILHIAGLWTALQSGMEGRRLVLLEKFEAAKWVKAVRTLKPTMAGMSPPLLRMVLDLDPPRADLASLRAIRCGSAALDGETRAEFERRYGVPLLSVYGATEYAGVVASWSLDDHRRFAAEKAGAAGRIRAQVAQARVVDADDGQVLPPGCVGLLELRVPRVREEWMRSSDLGSIDEDGFLMLHGRADNAIVRGGFKILPDQLAAVLRRHPAVADAAVVGLPDARLGQVPAAAVELRPGMAADAAELDRHMRAELPAYQAPARYRLVDRLPRTPAGKPMLAEVAALLAQDDEGLERP